ncbi:hypothetical protein HDK64DRAFT_297040 [Phyllosticta capitalensis]
MSQNSSTWKKKIPPEAPAKHPSKNRSKKGSRKKSIPYLPNEIIDNILSFCTRKTTLQSARLVSHAFSELAGRYLFKQIKVEPFTERDVVRLRNIAHTERLAPHVRELALFYHGHGRTISNVPDDDLFFLVRHRKWSPGRHLNLLRRRHDFSRIWRLLLSVRRLPNVESVRRHRHDLRRFDLDTEDDVLTLMLMALGEPLYGSPDSFRMLVTVDLHWSRKHTWVAPHNWHHALCYDSDSEDSNIDYYDSEQDDSGQSEPELGDSESVANNEPSASGKWPWFGLIKRLRLVNTAWPQEMEFHNEEEEGSLTNECSGSKNALESLTLDFIPSDLETLQGKPRDFFRSNALLAYEGFSYSPRLTRLELSRLTTAAATLLRFLRNTSTL